MNTVTPQNGRTTAKRAIRTVAELIATCTGACAHLHDDQEQKGGYPDTYRTTGCAGQQAQATDDLRDA